MKFLVIQTAFIGDVVLGTAVLEQLHQYFPDAPIYYLVRKGNESLLKNHPFLTEVFVWDKSNNKQINLWKMMLRIRSEKFTHVINLHRFATSGLLTIFSGAPYTVGFDKNPFSFLFHQKFPHQIDISINNVFKHEIERNQSLIENLTGIKEAKPRLYPTVDDEKFVQQFVSKPYICIAPSSVWFTKQFPKEKWIELIKALPSKYSILLLGGPGDKELCSSISESCNSIDNKPLNLAGKLSFLQSAALMKQAIMNYVNDSGPLHFASAVDAPVTAIFCSTIPSFGFGPLSTLSRVVEVNHELPCRPCGLHGHKVCPQGHFKCGFDIEINQLLWWISN